MHRLACGVSSSPVVPGPDTLLSDEEVLGVVYVSVGTGLDSIEHLVRFSPVSCAAAKEIVLWVLNREGSLGGYIWYHHSGVS